MKKIAMFFAAAAIAVSASAQKTAVTASKACDNIYVGINAGAATPTTNTYLPGEPSFSTFSPKLGVRVGKNFTTVFGLAVDAEATMNVVENRTTDHKTFIDDIDINLLGTANLMNLFAGYKGEPRTFEMIALGGFGWAHSFPVDGNALVSKVALDFAMNFGAKKQFQVYLEPSLTYDLEGFGKNHSGDFGGMEYDLNKSAFALKAGFNYKFGNSNGTNNFAVEQLRDQAEIDALNAKINAARQEADAANARANAKDAEIARLKKALSDCENKPAEVVKEVKTVAQIPNVVFMVGKSAIDKSQVSIVDMIAKYMKNHPESKIKVSGYASPEGNAEKNQILSEERANAVKTLLTSKKYGIAADRIETEGLGVKEGGDITDYEFMRIATIVDTTK